MAAAAAVAFALLAIFVAYPLVRVLALAFGAQDTLLAAAGDQRNALLRPLWNSLLLAAAVAVTGTTVAYAAAFAITAATIPLRRAFRFLLLLPMVAPPFMLALAAIMLLGRNGLITRHLLLPLFGAGAVPDIYGFGGLVLVQTLTYMPTALLLLLASLASIDPALEEAAQSQGASASAVFCHVTLPLSTPAILSSMLLLFLESLADFGNPLILGGDFRVLSVAAFLKITGEFDTAGGAALATMLLLPAGIAFFVQRHYLHRTSYATVHGRSRARQRPRSANAVGAATALVCLTAALTTALFFAGVAYASLVEVWSVTTELSLANYAAALRDTRNTLMDSLLLAAIAAPLTATFGFGVAWLVVRRQFAGRGLMSALGMLALGVPGTVLGIGYILAFNTPPLALTGTALIIVLLFIFRNVPIALEAGTTAIGQIDRSIEEGAASLGAPPVVALRTVILPVVAPAFFAALAHGFVRSLTAISAVIFVVSGQWNLLTVSILGYVENSDLSRASALCMILVLIVSAVLLLLQRTLARTGTAI